jgi:hypothetical protein
MIDETERRENTLHEFLMWADKNIEEVEHIDLPGNQMTVRPTGEARQIVVRIGPNVWERELPALMDSARMTWPKHPNLASVFSLVAVHLDEAMYGIDEDDAPTSLRFCAHGFEPDARN